MTLRNTHEQWGSVARGLHWIVAALIFTQFALGWTAEMWHRSPTKVDLFVWHKSIGILILTVVVIRVCWRLANRPPDPPSSMSAGERLAAQAVHVILYLLIIAMPLSGWVINSAANFPLKLFWLVPLPAITPPGKEIQEIAETVHLTIFWLLVVALAGHVGAALRHHFVKHDEVLVRMLGDSPADGGPRT
jgi:cytochrome b561